MPCLDQCVGCGKWDDLSRHHCDPKRERQIEGSRRDRESSDLQRAPFFGTRLGEGFAMLRGDLVAKGTHGGE